MAKGASTWRCEQSGHFCNQSAWGGPGAGNQPSLEGRAWGKAGLHVGFGVWSWGVRVSAAETHGCSVWRIGSLFPAQPSTEPVLTSALPSRGPLPSPIHTTLASPACPLLGVPCAITLSPCCPCAEISTVPAQQPPHRGVLSCITSERLGLFLYPLQI